ATARTVGVLGRDAAGDEVVELFDEAGIKSDGILRIPGRLTPVKTRLMAGGHESTRHQIVRLDREPEPGMPPDMEARVVERVKVAGRDAQAFLVSAYGYGTVGGGV